MNRDTATASARIRPAKQPASDVIIAFDGDDTLWHNESIFSMTQESFRALLTEYVAEKDIDEKLFAIETRNLGVFGYGIKGFILSMIETAIDVTGGRIPAADILTIIEQGKSMLAHPVELLDGVQSTIEELLVRYRLMLITKGDLFDQESKIARSALAEKFWRVEIVSEKDERTYARILESHDIEPERFIMVGNSVRSDILPIVAIGARAVYVPYHVTWAHEMAEIGAMDNGRMCTIDSIRKLPNVIEEMLTKQTMTTVSE